MQGMSGNEGEALAPQSRQDKNAQVAAGKPAV